MSEEKKQAAAPAESEQPKDSFYRADETARSASTEAVAWTASEFIAHDKSGGWYLGLAATAAILAFLFFILTKGLVSPAVVIVAAIIFGYYGSHQPRQLQYQLDNHGLTVEGKHHGFDQFKAYSVIPEGQVSSILFMPLKRFGAPLSVYYPPEDEAKIMALLSKCLPYENPPRDTVDSLMKKIRF